MAADEIEIGEEPAVMFAGYGLPQVTPATSRDRGIGPFRRMVLRGATVIDGTGAPPWGPVDIVVEGGRIAQIKRVGTPGLPINPDRRPAAGEHEIDCHGKYVTPGFIDSHGHVGISFHHANGKMPPADYVYKLWLAHGITSVRDPGGGNGIDWCVSEQKRSEANTITAPRIFPYAFFGQGRVGPMLTPEHAREWVRDMKRRGALGMKCFGYRPDILEAAFDELNKQDMGSACHHAQLDVKRVNVLTTARWGLTTMEHWYGLPEALFDGQTVQDYPPGYNYMNEQHRFEQAGRLWAQAAEKGSAKYEAVMGELLELDFTIDPTFTIYQATRDLMRARMAEWHEDYTLPALWDFFRPSRTSHGSFFFDWGSEQEIAWRDNYVRWMAFINDFKNRGGRVTVGSDSGYIYKLYGFGTIEELELLREAGFHPLEVLTAATLNGAEALKADERIGSIEPGKLADIVVLRENPLANLKVLYGTGHIRINAEGEPERVGGVRYTIKDGIVFDAAELLGEVRALVAADKQAKGIERLKQPGL